MAGVPVSEDGVQWLDWPRFALLGVAALGTIAFGIAFVVDGDFTNTAAIAAMATVGMLAAVASVPLSISRRHMWAAAAAFVAIVTPTGFAYVPNVLMLVAGMNEIRLAYRMRLGRHRHRSTRLKVGGIRPSWSTSGRVA